MPSSSSLSAFSLVAPQQAGMMAMTPVLLTPTTWEQTNKMRQEVRKQPLGIVKKMRNVVLV